MTDQRYDPQPMYQQTSSLAVISLIAGIASYFILPLVGAIAAIITGNLAKNEIRESAGQLTGDGLARAGLILGWINIGISLIGVCLGILVFTGLVSVSFCFIPFASGF